MAAIDYKNMSDADRLAFRQQQHAKVLTDLATHLDSNPLTAQIAKRIVRASHVDPEAAIGLLVKHHANIGLPSPETLDRRLNGSPKSDLDCAAHAIIEIGRIHKGHEENALQGAIAATGQRPSSLDLQFLLQGNEELAKKAIPLIETSTMQGKERVFYDITLRHSALVADSIAALGRIGTKDAQTWTHNIVRNYPIYKTKAADAFPEIQAQDEIDDAVGSYLSGDAPMEDTITQILGSNKASAPQQLVNLALDHVIRKGDKEAVIDALQSVDTDEAIHLIVTVGGSIDVRLKAIMTLEAMRENAADVCEDVDHHDRGIKSLLDKTMDLRVIQHISPENVSGFQAAFERADARKLSAQPYTETFQQAVAYLAQGRGVKNKLEFFRGNDLN